LSILDKKRSEDDILKYLEGASGEIQLLALNIAVAAAKIAHRQDLGVELNQRLSQLVNQATQTVKQMNQVLSAAGADKRGRSANEGDDRATAGDMLDDIENTMESIISDSEKITGILSKIKRRRD
jgi:ABC-type transporter Mla subunit MlaD